MNRWEFMRQLEELLADISPSEREEALQYYNDYFNDAGRENEAEVIEALGSPKQVAQTVKEGLGFETRSRENSNQENNSWNDRTGTESQSSFTNPQHDITEKNWMEEKKKQIKDLPIWAIVLIIIAVVIASPVLIGLLGSLFGTIFGILMSIIGIAIGIAAAAVALLLAALSLVITGIITGFTYPFLGIAMAGAGLICGAIGILFLILTILIFGKGIPAICRGIKYLWRKYIKKEKEVLA